MDPNKPPGIQIGQIFLESAHFSHRDDFLSLPPNTPLGNPDVTLTVQGGTNPDGRQGLVRVRAQTKPEQRPLYEIDVVMTALVEVIVGKENMSIDDYVRTSGPAMVLTFVREMVAELTWRGRFGPLWISPVNIAAITASPPSEVVEERVFYHTRARILRPQAKKLKRLKSQKG